MKKDMKIKLFLVGLFFVLSVLFVIVIQDNEAIFPSLLVAFFLSLTFLFAKKTDKSSPEKAARIAIVSFSIFIALLSLLGSIFLPIIAEKYNLSSFEMVSEEAISDPQLAETHFVEVLLNDFHEFCYITTLLLLIYLISLFISRKKLHTKD